MPSIHQIVSGLLRKRKREETGATLHRNGRLDVGRISVLSLLGGAQDRCVADEIGGQNGWEVVFANGFDEAHQLSVRIRPQIILVDRDVAGAGWRQEVSVLANAADGACVLLLSTVADDYLWNEVVLNGGYDVLRKPLSGPDLLHTVRLAWSYWNGIRQIPATAKK